MGTAALKNSSCIAGFFSSAAPTLHLLQKHPLKVWTACWDASPEIVDDRAGLDVGRGEKLERAYLGERALSSCFDVFVDLFCWHPLGIGLIVLVVHCIAYGTVRSGAVCWAFGKSLCACGEAMVWGHLADSSNLENVMWPRLAAARGLKRGQPPQGIACRRGWGYGWRRARCYMYCIVG